MGRGENDMRMLKSEIKLGDIYKMNNLKVNLQRLHTLQK